MSCYRFFSVSHCLIGLIAFILLFPVPGSAAPLRLAIVLSAEEGAYREFGSELSALLADKNVTVSVTDADNALPASDFVIAAGLKAAFAVARFKPAAMLAVLIPKAGYGKLLNDFSAQIQSGTSKFSAIYLDQPIKRQLDLIRAALPNISSIGVLYSAPPMELGALRMIAAAHKLVLNERLLNSALPLHAELQELLAGSDALLALPDAAIYNAATIRNILLTTYSNKVPLIGFSPAYVKAGALCAVFSTPEQIASQSVGIIQYYVATHILPDAQYAKEFEVTVNEQVARSLGLDIKSASQLRSEIGTTK